MKMPSLGLALKIGHEIERLAEINIGFAAMPEEKHALPDHTGIVLVPEEDVLETGVILFRTLLEKSELRHEKNGSFHVSLCFQKELDGIFFSMDEMSDKSLRIDEKDEGRDACVHRLPVKAGFIGTREVAVSVKIGHLRKNHFHEVGERQEQRHVEVEGDRGRRKAFKLEMIMGEQIVQLAAVFNGKYHRPFLVHLFQALPCAFIQFGALEKPVKQPAQEESWPVIEHTGIINFFTKGIQTFSFPLVWI
jgi:hypothetical protein